MPGLHCGDDAAVIAATELDMTLAEFLKIEDPIWSEIRMDNGAIIEEFQLGIGGGLIGIIMERAAPTCKQVGEAYSGQNDQD